MGTEPSHVIAAVEILPAERGRAHRQFLDLPYRLHRDDPRFVPPLRRERNALFDTSRHPFFQHAEAAFFLARRAGKPVGRIEAIVNHAHNRFHGDRVGFFGAFECEEARDASGALLEQAAGWLHSRGMEVMRGPVTHSTNEECGLLIDGFEDPPFVGMPYNPRYYPALLEAAGLEKAKDLHAWEVTLDRPVPEKLRRVAERVRLETRATVRRANPKDFDGEARRILEVYNASWEHNWGFVPLTEAEFAYSAEQLRPLLKRLPEAVLIAEADGRPVGFCLAVMDANQALIRVRNGRLSPFGVIRLLRGLSRVTQARVMALGIRTDYRRLGLDAVLVLELVELGKRLGYRRAELGWTLEDNAAVRSTIERGVGPMGLRRSKTYRLYDRVLT
jgi:GNAT superfamily N-acetyltransferase